MNCELLMWKISEDIRIGYNLYTIPEVVFYIP